MSNYGLHPGRRDAAIFLQTFKSTHNEISNLEIFDRETIYEITCSGENSLHGQFLGIWNLIMMSGCVDASNNMT